MRHATGVDGAGAVVVLAQAALGGVVVRFVTPAWATIAHACLAQLFFAILVAICVGLFAGFDGGWAAPTFICTAGLFAQTILGAAVRYGVVAPVAHIAGAVVATILVMWAGLSILMQHMENATLRRPAMLLLSITFSQVFLGIAYYGARGLRRCAAAHAGDGAGSRWRMSLWARWRLAPRSRWPCSRGPMRFEYMEGWSSPDARLYRIDEAADHLADPHEHGDRVFLRAALARLARASTGCCCCTRSSARG